MTVAEELDFTAELIRLSQVAAAARDLAEDLEADAGRSTKHCAELDYIASKLFEAAKACDEYRVKFEAEAREEE